MCRCHNHRKGIVFTLTSFLDKSCILIGCRQISVFLPTLGNFSVTKRQTTVHTQVGHSPLTLSCPDLERELGRLLVGFCGCFFSVCLKLIEIMV